MSDVLHAAAALRMLLQQSYFVPFALACFSALARVQVPPRPAPATSLPHPHPQHNAIGHFRSRCQPAYGGTEGVPLGTPRGVCSGDTFLLVAQCAYALALI